MQLSYQFHSCFFFDIRTVECGVYEVGIALLYLRRTSFIAIATCSLCYKYSSTFFNTVQKNVAIDVYTI